MSRAALILVPPIEHSGRVSRLVCPACSDYFGIPGLHARVTIRPADAFVMPSGQVVIDSPIVLCAGCLERGIETLL